MGRSISSIIVATAIIATCHPKSLSMEHSVEAFSPSPLSSSRKRRLNIISFHNHNKLNIDTSSSTGARINSPFDTVSSRTSVICHASPIVRGAVVAPVIVGTTSIAKRIISHGVTKFMSNWKAYSLIPLVAGFVGW